MRAADGSSARTGGLKKHVRLRAAPAPPKVQRKAAEVVYAQYAALGAEVEGVVARELQTAELHVAELEQALCRATQHRDHLERKLAALRALAAAAETPETPERRA